MNIINHRLPTADIKYIDVLLEKIKTNGQTVEGAELGKLEKGDIILTETKSGNIYLLEIVETGKDRVYIYRYQKRNDEHGYLGEHTVYIFDKKDRLAPGMIRKGRGINAHNVGNSRKWASTPLIKIILAKSSEL